MDGGISIPKSINVKFETLLIICNLGEPKMSPDSCHSRITREKIRPNLQMLYFLKVFLWVVGAVKESPVERTQDVLPPLILLPGELEIFLGDKAAYTVKLRERGDI